MINKRYESLDCLKGVACLAVVFIHYNFPWDLGIIVRTLAKIGVPIFFLISGFFSLKDGNLLIHSHIQKKIYHIASIFVKAAFFFALFCVIWNHWRTPDWQVFTYVEKVITYPKIMNFWITNDPFEYAHLWFLLALIYCYVSMMIFKDYMLFFSSHMKILGIIGLILLIGYNCLQEFHTALGISCSVHTPGAPENYRIMLFNLFIFRALPFFLGGVLLRYYESYIKVWRWLSMKAIFLLCMSGFFLAVVERFTFIESQFYIGTYVVVFTLFTACIRHPDVKIAYLNYIGRNLSLYVYILHIAVGKCLDLLAEKNHLWQYTAFNYSKLFLIIILTLILSYIIHQGYVSFNKWHTCKKDVYHV